MFDTREDRRIVAYAIEILESAREQVIQREWGAKEIVLPAFDHLLERLRDADVDDDYELQTIMFDLRIDGGLFWTPITKSLPWPSSPSRWRLGFACKSAARVLEELIGEYWLDP
jgi:hypothetical protein